MEQEKLNIDDGSGDKEFFTIIPNYILNHSTGPDQALYLQLKRLAGDKKSNYCYPSFRYLKKQLKVGESSLKKSFKYIIDHRWVDNLGKRRVRTKGGYQWVNSYKINNIWKLNMDYYRGVSSQEHLEDVEVSPEFPKVSPKTGKVYPVIGAKEDPLKKELLKKDNKELNNNLNDKQTIDWNGLSKFRGMKSKFLNKVAMLNDKSRTDIQEQIGAEIRPSGLKRNEVN